MNHTPYYNLPVYELTDQCSIPDGYNKAVVAIDAELRKLQNEIDLLTQKVKVLQNA